MNEHIQILEKTVKFGNHGDRFVGFCESGVEDEIACVELGDVENIIYWVGILVGVH